MEKKLTQKKCGPCEAGTPPLKPGEFKPFMAQISGWDIEVNRYLAKEFTFKDFQSALDFVNVIGSIAEEEGHHPDLYLTWGKVGVKLFTHKINGLSENDFILAAKIDEQY